MSNVAEFVRQAPKTDLHVHLDGSLRLETLIELARREGVKLPSYEVAGLRETVFKDRYADLTDYLKGFAYTCAVMRNPENLERIAYELAQDNLAENVRYIEVRFAPQLHVHEAMDTTAVVRAVCRGLDRARAEHNRSEAVRQGRDIPFAFGVILCALRCFSPEMSAYYRDLFRVMAFAPRKQVFAAASLELARAAVTLKYQEGLPVVGFDLAGEEKGYPAVAHREAYRYAHRHFLKKTVHAGEAYGPESIFQAITECYANRIGHGTFLFAADMVQDPEIEDPQKYVDLLAEYIASQRITIEVCPTSNLQTIPEFDSLSQHPIRQMIDHNLSVTICTDNRLVSNTTVTNEILSVLRAIPLTRHQLRNIIVAGFKGSFFPEGYREKRTYVRRMLNMYESLEQRILGKDDGQPLRV
ncbi:MAG TPA: adenosine deaminase family protein [Lentisphaerae bacterium]|nr:adenosine deaminase family protein [Lentisphaerota bacterium]